MGGVFYSAIHDIPIMSLVAMGFYISLRIMRFPDLSVDASYMFGMSAVGWVVANSYSNELPALPLAMLFGALVGAVTGMLHTSKLFGLSKLLSGLLVSFAAYSICFRLIGSKTPLNLFPYREDMFLVNLFGSHDVQALSTMLFVIAFYYLTVRFMNTSFGYGVRSVGYRKEVIQAVGIKPNMLLIGGLAFSNLLVSSAGWVNAANNTNIPLQNFGMVVHALAAVLIGEFAIFILMWLFSRKNKPPVNATSLLYLSIATPILGAAIYSFVKAFVIHILSGQLKIAITTDFQLVLSILILAIVGVSRNITGYRSNNNDDAI